MTIGQDKCFARTPRGWYYASRSGDLRARLVPIEVQGNRFVAFRGVGGRATVLKAACSHMGADLSRGRVVNGTLECPLHAWRYDAEGRCVCIPASTTVPPFARQVAYPTEELNGHVVFFNSPQADFAMPFYDGKNPADLFPAFPFDFVVNAPWYMVGANAFDLQHFRVAHDRTLIDTPVIDCPCPFARRITATYRVAGHSMRDRLTRYFSGSQVRMSVCVWGGTNILVTAEFGRTTSYGMVFVRPLDENRTQLRTIVWVPRRRNALGKAILDPLDAWVRRWFIREFVKDDTLRSDGVRYNPATLIDADREMSQYMSWLAAISDSGNLPPPVERKRYDHAYAASGREILDGLVSNPDHRKDCNGSDDPSGGGINRGD